jgi:hypothetical protein
MTHCAARLSLLSLFASVSFACGADPNAGKPSAVVISEVMYHPVSEDAAEDNHEFIEIYNRSESAVDLTNWKLTGDVSFAFPEGANIAPQEYRVIAKNRAALSGIPGYMLNVSNHFGDYAGELDNGGGTVNLVDSSDRVADSLTYDDEFPWPIGADALGADDEWLGLLPTPISSAPHKHRGRSLERVSFEVGADEISNWVASPIDGATPGRANSASGTPPAIVVQKRITWSGSDLLIRAADTVKLGAIFSTLGPYSNPRLEYFIDDVQGSGEPLITLDMTLNGGVYEATLPPQPDNSIVRYRILADRGSGPEVISPRASDPFTFWAYFVTPPVSTTSAFYQVFIKKDDWNQMYDNVNFPTDDRRVAPGGSPQDRCQLRPTWDAKVPAVFISNGAVYDTFVRYQGSRWNRLNGVGFDPTKTTIDPLPDRPANRVLSWKIDFPDYAPFEGKRRKLVLNKMNQACPGLGDALAERLYGDPTIDVPVQKTRYTRFHVNGGYYHYMLDLEHIDEDLVKRYRMPGEKVGDLFKADGNAGPNNLEGPIGIADERVLQINPDCPGWSLDDRYAYTYQRMTNKWDNVSALRAMIETLNALRMTALSTGDWGPMRSFFMDNFEYPKLLDYMTLRNWSEPWDDTIHNHFLYRRDSTKKWLMIPQDKDLEFSEFFGWQTGRSFFIGEQGDPDNRNGLWNVLKDSFIRTFRAELVQRIRELDATGVLSPTNYQARVDQAASTFNNMDYDASPAAANVCNFNTELARLRAFGDCRHQDVIDMADAAACTQATCGLTGSYYQTAAGDTSRNFATATLRLTRNDPKLAFDWLGGSPGNGVPVDNFQVRWTGRVVPRYTEQYTFCTFTDDGARLMVNGATLVDRWMDQNPTEYCGTINLTANMPVTVTMEYYASTGNAQARLMWSSASQCKQQIPPTRLRPM